jgi:hypothetical protein
MYSNKSLEFYKSVGIKEGASIKLINEPDSFFTSQNENTQYYLFQKHLKEPVDLIHLFTKSKKELSVELPSLVKFLKPDGVLMVTWPKETEKFTSDLDYKFVTDFGNQLSLAESGAHSIDEDWSTLTFLNKLIQKND